MIYLDNAATTRFKPLSVKLEALKEICFSANSGRGAHKAAVATAMKIEDCRNIIRKNFFDGQVVFTKNCTEALNLGIFGIEPDNQVISTCFEHNSVLRPLQKLSSEKKCTLTLLSPNSNNSIEKALISALKYPTSLFVITAMSNVTGQTTNVEKLCSIVKQNSQATTLVDISQAAGHLKLNYKNIDMIATSGHKSLHGIQGSGFLLCKNNIKLTPIIIGGTGTNGLSLQPPMDIPDGMEAGTLNSPSICALKAGVEWTYKNFNKLNSRISRLTEALKEGLSTIEGLKVYSANNGILLCNFSKISCSDLSDALSHQYGICIRSGLHCAPLMHKLLKTAPSGAARFAIGYNNSLTDIEKTIDAMIDLSHKNNI